VTEEPFLCATRASYDTVAVSYAELVPPVEEDPVERALVNVFADLVRAPVVDRSRTSVAAPAG
jgi:hypothetical protein